MLNDPKDFEIYNLLLSKEKTYSLEKEKIECLKIHVSNTCNLQCKYCYANYGNYGESNAIMSKSIARDVSVFIKQNFQYVNTITFFGGEALLAIEAIEEICENFKNKNIRFLLQTNGTILNDKILGLINKYNIKITISLDGPKKINDANRIYLNGKGTYDCIVNNIRKLQRETNSLISIQSTYTSISTLNQYNKNDLSTFFKKYFNLNHMMIKDVVTTDKNLKVIYNSTKDIKNQIEITFNQILNEGYISQNEITYIVESFFNQEYNDNLCEAGLSMLSITADGKLYPCQLYVNMSNYDMGSIYIHNINSYEKFISVRDKLSKLKKSNISKCNECIAKFWCNRCLGKAEILHKEFENYYEENLCGSSESNCVSRRSLTELVLNKLSYCVENNLINKLNDTLINIQESLL